MRDLIGEEIGPYKILEKLGRGGMADVYKAFHVDLEINRAIKVIRPEFVGADDFKARFQREAKAVAALQHPNIVQVHDFGSHEGNFYMVMEFVEGQDLKRIIKTQGAMRPISEAINIVLQIARALHFAHGKGLLHRDIKPENIMLRADGSPVLMDFGIAKLLTAETQLTQTGVGIGTPSYMSPEQAQATDKLGPSSDLYSLTVVLYEMLTGQVPYSADTPIAVMLKVISDPLPLPRQLSPDISEPLQQFLIKGTSKDPERRHLNGEEYANALQALNSELNQEALDATVLVEPPASNTVVPEPVTTKAGRSWLGKVLALIVGIAVLALLYVFWPNPKTAPVVDSSVERAQTAALQATVTETNTVAAPQSTASAPASSVVMEYRGPSANDAPVIKNLQLKQNDVLFMDVHSASSTSDFALEKKGARKADFSSYSDYGPYTVRSTGNYHFSIKPRKGEAEVDVQLWRLTPAVIEAGALEKNEITSGSTLAPGQTARYTVELDAGNTVFFDVLKTSSTSDFSIVYPDGRNMLHRPTYADYGPINVEQSGLYSVLVDPRGDATVDYEFTLHAYQAEIIQPGEVEFGKWYELSIQHPGQSAQYDLDVDKGAVIYLEIGEVSSTTDFIIASQDGRETLLKSYSDTGEAIEVPDQQQYKLLVDPRGDNLSEFEFRLHRLETVVLDGGAIVLDKFVSGNTLLPGQSVRYSFTTEKDTELQFDLSKSAVTTDFKIIAPDGRTELLSTYRVRSQSIAIPTAGTYTIVADPRNAKLADFEFRLSGNK